MADPSPTDSHPDPVEEPLMSLESDPIQMSGEPGERSTREPDTTNNNWSRRGNIASIASLLFLVAGYVATMAATSNVESYIKFAWSVDSFVRRLSVQSERSPGAAQDVPKTAFLSSSSTTDRNSDPATSPNRIRRLDEVVEEHHHHHHDEDDAIEEEPFADVDDDERSSPTLYDPSENQNGLPSPKEKSLELDKTTVVESASTEDYTFLLQELSEKLRPRPMLSFDVNATKQFAHLHHMKTGGTSINRLISCALGRARDMHQAYTAAAAAATAGKNFDVDANDNSKDASAFHPPKREHVLPFYSLEECSHSRYLSCINDNTKSAQSCRSSIESASVMQYCAPLHQVSRFHWLQADIVSVIRHPVDRVWSMFRFQTKGCFKCTPLLEIYDHIDNGTLDDFCGPRGCGGVCIPQLLNHETRNLLTDTWDDDDAGGESLSSDEEKLEEALYNLNHRVTLVGITDELPTFANMLGRVFPWLAENVTAEELGLAFGDDNNRYLRTISRRAADKSSADPKSCPLSHANASPKNNRCGSNNKHWDLPDQPDEETRQAILRHNQLDLKIYEAARTRFELQKQALGL